jgi:hypothetical protein
MNDSTQKFMSHFKMPKSQINALKKEFKTSKEASEKINPEHYKNFKEMGNFVFDAFEEMTGKRTNREVMLGNLSYYFDEGFEVEEMKVYMGAKISEDFFKENPELFTISMLFPIRDQDRINNAWDRLSYYKSQQKKLIEKKEKIQLQMGCGHWVYRSEPYCPGCVTNEDLLEVARNPYAIEVPEHLKTFANFFKRQNDESFEEYQTRTLPEFLRLNNEKRLYAQNKLDAGLEVLRTQDSAPSSQAET